MQMSTARRRHGPPKPRLLKWAELELWQQDNPYIRSGYRPSSHSFAVCCQSLFWLHNESVNVHSHLLGAFLFAATAPTMLSVLHYSHGLQAADAAALGCFFIGAVACLGISSGYHLVSNHSAAVSRWANQLDYGGIVLLIVGSFIPSIYYGFYCNVALQQRYWSLVGVFLLSCLAVQGQVDEISAIGALCITTTLHPRFRSPSWRPTRTAMFVAMGLSGLVPILHGYWLYGWHETWTSVGLLWLLLQGLLYVLGAGIYAARVPEKLLPGSFDIWGSSHQIFHFLIIFAAAAHLVGLWTAFDHSRRRVCPPA